MMKQLVWRTGRLGWTLAGLLFCMGLAHSEETPLSNRYRIRFDEELKLRKELRIEGNSGEETIAFRCESTSKPLSGSRLHLWVSHSSNLDPDRSFLSVSLNYGVVRSLRLGDSGSEHKPALVVLPPDLLKGENRLTFSVTQYARPGSPQAVWTAIQPGSFIEIQGETVTARSELRNYPSPIIDPYSYRQQAIGLLVPNRAEVKTLEAAALLVANLCNTAPGKQLQVIPIRSLQKVRMPVLIVGTRDEQPVLGFLDTGSLFRFEGSHIRLADGQRLAESDGLICLISTSEPRSPLLVITAETPAGVLKAVRRLQQRSNPLEGRVARVTDDRPTPKASLRDWKGFIPNQDHFRLSDLGLKEVPIRARQGTTPTILFRALPDTRFLHYGQRMDLSLRFGKTWPAGDCSLEVHLNGKSLGSYPARDLVQGGDATLSLDIPTGLVRFSNRLEMVWQGPCEGTSAVLLEESRFYLPREHEVELPDLALLQHHAYPLSLRPDFSDVILVIPEAFPAEAWPVLIELSSAFGRLAPADSISFQLRQARDLSSVEKAGSHLVTFCLNHSTDLFQKTDGWKWMPWTESLKTLPTVQEQLSPWNNRKTCLVFSAVSWKALGEAIQRCFSSELLQELRGDAAYLTPTGPLCLELTARQIVRERSYLTRLQAWLRVNWLALPLILAAASLLLFIGLRLLLSHYQRSRNNPQQTSAR
ncbi:MAG: cellulose biosynthesis cyclic di-GMP-binding regulatory protein BcsB [Acidobacteriota bacterium]